MEYLSGSGSIHSQGTEQHNCSVCPGNARSPSSLFELPGDQPGALLAIHSKLVCFTCMACIQHENPPIERLEASMAHTQCLGELTDCAVGMPSASCKRTSTLKPT
jgi:hypothetical protein